MTTFIVQTGPRTVSVQPESRAFSAASEGARSDYNPPIMLEQSGFLLSQGGSRLVVEGGDYKRVRAFSV